MIISSGPADAPRGAIFGDRQLDAIRRAEAGVRWGDGEPRLLGAAYPEFLNRLPCVLQSGATVYSLPSAARSGAESGEGSALENEVETEIRATAELGLPALTGTPERLAAVLAHPALGELDFSALHEIVVLGAAPEPALAEALRDRFDVRVRTEYLPMEAGLGVGTRRDGPPDDVPTSVGQPAVGVTVSIRDSAGRPVGAGSVGEVLLRSGAVMSGYWNDPAATARAITKDGFVRTGDLGRLDTEGRLHLVDPAGQPGQSGPPSPPSHAAGGADAARESAR
jgi:long-chain acyl-CoA synthetase